MFTITIAFYSKDTVLLQSFKAAPNGPDNISYFNELTDIDAFDMLVVDLDTININKYELRKLNKPVIVLSCGHDDGLDTGEDFVFLQKTKVTSVLFNNVFNANLAIAINSLITKNSKSAKASTINKPPAIKRPFNKKVVGIASSTGGTEALERLLIGMPEDGPPILIVQHMISGFTKIFAERLNSICKMQVDEAKTGDIIRDGLVLIAPSDYHMEVEYKNNMYRTNCFASQKMHGVMPAADILFFSMAECFQEEAVGVVLTGMGADGAQGVLKMHQNGAKTICQDQETSVIYGMPKIAKQLGGIDYELPLDDICKMILRFSSQ